MKSNRKLAITLLMLIFVAAFSGSACAASIVYVGNVGFDLDQISNDEDYASSFTNYVVENSDATLIVDFEGYIFDVNAFSNATEYTNIIEFAQAQPSEIPESASTWDG